MIGNQLTFHWSRLARPRLAGLTDDEYLWEPVPDCWSLRQRPPSPDGQDTGLGLDSDAYGSALDPVTTIAWRLAHVIVDVLAARTHRLFGGPFIDRATFGFPATAQAALAQLDDAYRLWSEGVNDITEENLTQPCGLEEPYFQNEPVAALLLHVNREVLCHCAEAGLLRDLYARQNTST